MNRVMQTAIQAVVLLAVSAGVGFGLNRMAAEPLPWEREPVSFEDERWVMVTGAEVMEHINAGSAMVIDARAPEDYASGHILGAINIPEKNLPDSFMEYADFLPRDLLLIVYCGGGDCDQSVKVLELMHTMGFTELGLYEAGWEDWERQGFPADSL